ncbi:MAG: acetylxylan esterase, partial [Planctomycetota bacterium]
GKYWEEAGFAEYDGYAWYRVRFYLPRDWKRSTDKTHDFLVLSLGYVDDVDVTYFNGEKVGETGVFPPEYVAAYAVERDYRIPKKLIRWGKSNVIAVRVYDDTGPGGIYKVPVIRPAEIGDILQIKYEIAESAGVYPCPGPLPIALRISNNGAASRNLKLRCRLQNDRIMGETIIESTESRVSICGNGKLQKEVTLHPPGPGFYRLTSTLEAGKEEAIKESILIGYGPEKIETPLTREPDFEDFWDRRKKELAQIEPAFKVVRSDRSTSDLDVHLVEMRSRGNVLIRGWYTVPKRPGRHPAILSVPGYGGTMRPDMHRKNVATFALNPRGHGNSKDDIDPKGEEYMYLGFDPNHPEEYIYVGAYMDCVRAVDFLASRPEIDKSRIGVEGGSQGGGLSFATAALDQRIAFCAPDIPWLGDWVGYLEGAQWAHDNYPRLTARFPGLTFEGINRVLSYVDTMNLAERIECPVLMSVGLQDDVCPPRTAFSVYNRIQSEKEYRVYPFAGHGVGHKHNKFKGQWMAEKFGLGKSGL